MSVTNIPSVVKFNSYTCAHKRRGDLLESQQHSQTKLLKHVCVQPCVTGSHEAK